jgi:hypothetical protein
MYLHSDERAGRTGWDPECFKLPPHKDYLTHGRLIHNLDGEIMSLVLYWLHMHLETILSTANGCEQGHGVEFVKWLIWQQIDLTMLGKSYAIIFLSAM